MDKSFVFKEYTATLACSRGAAAGTMPHRGLGCQRKDARRFRLLLFGRRRRRWFRHRVAGTLDEAVVRGVAGFSEFTESESDCVFPALGVTCPARDRVIEVDLESLPLHPANVNVASLVELRGAQDPDYTDIPECIRSPCGVRTEVVAPNTRMPRSRCCGHIMTESLMIRSCSLSWRLCAVRWVAYGAQWDKLRSGHDV